MIPDPPSSTHDTADIAQDVAALSLNQSLDTTQPQQQLKQDTQDAAPAEVAAAAAQPAPEIHAQPVTPTLTTQKLQQQPASQQNSRSIGKRTYALTEIPSAYDLYDGGGANGNGSTPTNKTRSVASSSSDIVPFPGETKPRFEKLPQGGHRHSLCAPKRHQFLANQVHRFRGILDGMKDKDAHAHAHAHGHGHHFLSREVMEHPLSLLHEKVKDFEADHEANGNNKKNHNLQADFIHKYGDLKEVVGRGAFGTVRLSVKKTPETGGEIIYAIKEFKHAHDESQKSYMRRLTSEFCIASTLTHPNVIQTLDLLQLHGDAYSEVMEYCPGGDMHTLIASAGTLGETEAGCFFSQLINGVAFLHSMGVVHRDLKPENLLLTADGCVKIADFGNSEVFRMPWEKKVRASMSIRGSGPFIAPEEFTCKIFDARKVDTWSCGIIYMCMRLGRYNWAEASKGEPNWDSFLFKVERWQEMKGIVPEDTHASKANASSLNHAHVPKFINLAAIEAATHAKLPWPDHICEVIDRLLDPNPKNRWQAGHVLGSEWMQNVDNCHPTDPPADQALDESEFEPTPSQRVGSKVVQQNTEVNGDKVHGTSGINR